MIVSLLLIGSSQASLLNQASNLDLRSVVYARDTGNFVTYQANFGAAPDQVISFDKKGVQVSRISLSIPASLVGFDEQGSACLRTESAGMSSLRSGRLVGSTWQLDHSSIYVRGRWIVSGYSEGLVLFERMKPIRLVPSASSEDTFGVDANSGRLVLLKTERGYISLEYYDVGVSKAKVVRLNLPKGTVDGFPECSMEFIDKNRILCVLRIPNPTESDATAMKPSICLINIASKTMVPMFPIKLGYGHQPQATRNRIALGDDTVAFLEDGELKLLALKQPTKKDLLKVHQNRQEGS